MFGVTLSSSAIFQGSVTGVVFGLLAVGLVLVYQSSGVVNFAHTELGLIAATLCELLVTRGKVPYWMSWPAAIGTAATLAALCEFVVIRRLRSAPRVMSVVATLGLSQVLIFLTIALRGDATSRMPLPPGFPEFSIGPVFFNRASTAILILGPLMVIGVYFMLAKSALGRRIRGCAANPDAARLAGLSPERSAAWAWGVAGALSGASAILVTGHLGAASAGARGPALLVPAIAAAILARFRSIPVAFGSGLVLGIIQQLVGINSETGGVVQLVTFAVVMGGLLLQSPKSSRDSDRSNWMTISTKRLSPRAATLRTTIFGAGTLLIGVIGLGGSSELAVDFTYIVATATVALSLFIVTGLSGQLSLGQFAVAGVGATVGIRVSNSTGQLLLGFVAAGIAGALTCVLVCLPGVRLRGLFSAVTTLSFALLAREWLFPQTWMMGSSLSIEQTKIGGLRLESTRSFLFVVLAVFVLVSLVVHRLATTGTGRKIRALRDNEGQARGFAIPALKTKALTFALAGFVAGVGGVSVALSLSTINPSSFSTSQSVLVVAIAVIGGLQTVTGVVLGTAYLVGLPQFLPLDAAGLAATSFGWLLIVLFAPSGLSGLLDKALGSLFPRAKVDELVPGGALKPWDLPVEHEVGGRDTVRGTLTATGLSKRFGGVTAVNAVDFTVNPGESIGLIGANGAGKTTLFELLAGFTPSDQGTVMFEGREIGKLNAEQRARLGIVRSFQDAALFSTFTVKEVLQLAVEKTQPTSVWRSVLMPGRSEAKQRGFAEKLIAQCGLGNYADSSISELSTGTRRIVELAAVMALKPRLLLLDEPSAGIAQRETEALANVIVTLKQQLNTTLVVVEHDVPFVRALSDRIVVMETGRVIANGEPGAVLNDPAVIASYLGTNTAAIERSGDGASSSVEPSTAQSTESLGIVRPALSPQRRWSLPTRAARSASIRRVVTKKNRELGWITLPLLLLTTLVTWAEPRWDLPKWLGSALNTTFTLNLLGHAFASIYLFRFPRPRPRRQVVHVYLGYAVLLFTLASQSLVGTEPIHSILVAPLWLFIGIHVAFGAQNWARRRNRGSLSNEVSALESDAPNNDAPNTVENLLDPVLARRESVASVADLTMARDAAPQASIPRPNRVTREVAEKFGRYPIRLSSLELVALGTALAAIALITTNRSLKLIRAGDALIPAAFFGVMFLHVLLLRIWLRLRKPSGVKQAWIVAAVIVGLMIDNAILAVGNLLGEGSLLQALNRPRYWIHALGTPLILPIVIEIGAACGLTWCVQRRRWWQAVTGAFITFGVWFDIVRQRLEFTTKGGVARYANEVISGPPVNAIAANILAIAVGVMIWQKGHRATMAIFSILMLVGAGAGVSIPVVGNLAECIFVLALLAGMQSATGHDVPARAWRANPNTSLHIPWTPMALVVLGALTGLIVIGSNVKVDHGPVPILVGLGCFAGLLVCVGVAGVKRETLTMTENADATIARATRFGSALFFAIDAVLLIPGNVIGQRFGVGIGTARVVVLAIALALVWPTVIRFLFGDTPPLRRSAVVGAMLATFLGVLAISLANRTWSDSGHLLRHGASGMFTPGLVVLVAVAAVLLASAVSALTSRSRPVGVSLLTALFAGLSVLGALWAGHNNPGVLVLAEGALMISLAVSEAAWVYPAAMKRAKSASPALVGP
jgi:ABC-type branched-subunit amino acid transport system ATPase component/branched-subunit amino acid ABC-type transport system permease component